MQLSEVVNRLHHMTGYRPEKRGYGYMAICPAHDDLRPSLSVFTYKNHIVFNCFRGCDKQRIKELVNVGNETESKGKVQYDTTPFWELPVEKTYNYVDARGKLCYQKVRFIPKSFAIRYRKKSGRWGWGMNGYEPILYNLPNVIKAHTIFIVEGEKNADAVNKLGLTATCNYDGAGKWLNEYNRFLYAKTLYLIPDNDPPGIEHMQLVHESVCKISRSKIIELPGLSYKQDIYDWLQMGYDGVDLLNITN